VELSSLEDSGESNGSGDDDHEGGDCIASAVNMSIWFEAWIWGEVHASATGIICTFVP
jgi:hypothetical protein